jgi:hypothetical protein
MNTLSFASTTPSGESWASPNGSNNNAIVLYLKDEAVTSYNRFVVTPHIPGLTLSLEATVAGLAIGGWKEEDVTFTQGLTATNPQKTVSTGTKAIAGVAGFVEFEAKSNTSAAVNKETGAFTWNVNKIKYGGKAKTNGGGTMATTAPVTIYTVLDVPKYVWEPEDKMVPDPTDPAKMIPKDDKTQPWVSALEFAIQTANVKGKTTSDAALSQLTTFLHTGHGMAYDTTTGASQYFNLTEMKFDLTGYMVKSLGNLVNCYDQARLCLKI